MKADTKQPHHQQKTPCKPPRLLISRALATWLCCAAFLYQRRNIFGFESRRISPAKGGDSPALELRLGLTPVPDRPCPPSPTPSPASGRGSSSRRGATPRPFRCGVGGDRKSTRLNSSH